MDSSESTQLAYMD